MKRALLSFVLLLISSSFPWALQAREESCHRGRSLSVTQLGPKRSGPRWSFTSGSGLKERLRTVIRTREAWVEMWKRIYNANPPDEAMALLPEVDFSREMLIIAALGERPTGGYGIVVDSACKRQKELEIVVRSISHVTCGGVTQSLTQPLDIVRLPKSELPVAFAEVEVDDCKMGTVP